jgi:hypothetical protein
MNITFCLFREKVKEYNKKKTKEVRKGVKNSFTFFFEKGVLIMLHNIKKLKSFFFKIFSLKLKIRGLGYRQRRRGKLIRIFLGVNHYYYLYNSKKFFIKIKKKSIYLFSIDNVILNLVYKFLVTIREMVVYFKGNKGKGIRGSKIIRFRRKMRKLFSF